MQIVVSTIALTALLMRLAHHFVFNVKRGILLMAMGNVVKVYMTLKITKENYIISTIKIKPVQIMFLMINRCWSSYPQGKRKPKNFPL